MDRRLFTGAAVLGLGFVLAGGALAGPPASTGPLLTLEPDDHTMGSPHARVTVIEYASASCPHCARFNNDVFPAFKAKYIDTGRVFYVFREFLTAPVELAAAAFVLARCEPRGRYFSVVDGMFHAQQEIYDSNQMRGPMLKVAAANGLDEKAVDACLADKAAVAALNARVDRYAKRDGIDSTPTFLINGVRLRGEQTLAQLDVAIAAAEAGVKGKRTRHRHHRA